jgi:hypothetical protein
VIQTDLNKGLQDIRLAINIRLHYVVGDLGMSPGWPKVAEAGKLEDWRYRRAG